MHAAMPATGRLTHRAPLCAQPGTSVPRASDSDAPPEAAALDEAQTAAHAQSKASSGLPSCAVIDGALPSPMDGGMPVSFNMADAFGMPWMPVRLTRRFCGGAPAAMR